MQRFHLAIVALATLVLPACASATGPWVTGGPAAAYQHGYDLGHRAGDDDARRGRPFDYRDEVDYRRGDGDRSGPGYTGTFREGFATGYRDGYEARLYAASRRPPARGPVWQGPAGRPGVAYDPAIERGYADGYEAGADDGEAGRAYEPVRERAYREADAGYDRSYGSLEAYKAGYRTGFRRGYEDGYRQAGRWNW